MTFLHPLLLGAGLACVAIPIVIHLLMRRRRKPVRWAAMRFLLEAYKQRRRRVQLEQILLLAARCLLLALIAFAIGRPMLGHAGPLDAGSKDLYLLVDTSLGSALVGGDGRSALDASVERARGLLAGLSGARGDRAGLIAMGGSAAGVVLPPTSDLAQVERALAELAPTDGAMDLPGALTLAGAGAAEPPAVKPVVAVLSEFREGSLGHAAPLPLLPEGAAMIAAEPAATPAANIGISGAEILRPVLVKPSGDEAGLGAGAQVRVRLVRSGAEVDRAGVSRVRAVSLTGQMRREIGASVIEWSPGQAEAQATIDVDAAGSLDQGRAILKVEIDRDANERDNATWVVLQVRDKLRVALIGARRFGERPRITEFGPTDWLELALRPLTESDAGEIALEILDAARLEPAQLAGFDAAVIAEPERLRPAGWSAIGAFSSRGGALLVCAAPGSGAQLWIDTALPALSLDWDIDRDPADVPPESGALIVNDAASDDLLWFLRGELPDLASTVQVSRVLAAAPAGIVLLETADARPVLMAALPGAAERPATSGVVALLNVAIDLAWTDLPARPLMVPLVQELIRSGVGRAGSVRSAVAGGRISAPLSAVELREIEAADRSQPVDPSTGLTRSPVTRAGIFEARDARGLVVGVVTVHPDAAAGLAHPSAADRVGAWLSTALPSAESFSWADDAIASAGAGESTRRPNAPGPGLALLGAALALACVELLLARLVSHAARPLGQGGAP